MKVFVINLRRSIDRRRSMEKQLDRIGANYQIVEAVDGYRLTSEEISETCEQAALDKGPQWLSRGAIGCALSHRQTMEMMVAGNIAIGAILEDDVIVPDNFLEVLSEVEQRCEEDEVVMLHWSSWIDQPFIKNSAETIGTGYRLATPTSMDHLRGTVGYVITLNAARRITQANRPVRATSDSWNYFEASHCFSRLRCLVPPLIDLTHESSEVRRETDSALMKLKRYLETNFTFVQYISVVRRRRLFSRHTKYHFVEY